MDNTELLTKLENDLATVSAPKQAHIQIERILRLYKEQVAEKPKEKKK